MKAAMRQVYLKIKEHIWGPVGSVLLHIVVIALLVQFATSGGTTPPAATQIVIMQPDSQKLDEIDKALEKEIEKAEELPEKDVVTPPTDVPVISETPVVADGPGPSDGNASGSGKGTGLGSGDSAGSGFQFSAVRGPLIMKGLYGSAYGGRMGGARAAAMKAYKAPAGADDVVLRALRWLKKTQKEDGSWAGEEVSAMTGFALLCYMAHGETPASQEFGATVEKAIKYLIGVQGATQKFSANGYAHGIATYAMCESYAMTKNMAIKDAAEKGLQVIIDGQQQHGGFDYNYAKGERWDTSVSGWQFQAMKAGKMGGCQNEGLERAIEKSISFLKNTSFNATSGSFSYSGNGPVMGPGGSWTMTGAGCLSLQLLGHAKDLEVKAGLNFLDNQVCKWSKEGKNPIYGWYYVTQAKFQDGGARWDAWNKVFAKELMDAQLEDGHWEGGDHGKETYTTCICCLMLEVYYRYLPTYRKVEEVEPVKATSDDDVKIDVS